MRSVRAERFNGNAISFPHLCAVCSAGAKRAWRSKGKRIHSFPWQPTATETGAPETGNLRVVRHTSPNFLAENKAGDQKLDGRDKSVASPGKLGASPKPVRVLARKKIT